MWGRRTIRDGLRQIVDRIGLALVDGFFRLTGAGRSTTVRRSLWTGTPIINMAVNARAERLLGVEAHSLVDHTYHVTHEFDYNLSRWMRLKPLGLVLPYFVLVWACLRYQRFHFYCDRGILPSRKPLQFHPGELSLLRRLGKEIYFWTYGADVRTRHVTEALGRYHCCFDCPRPGVACICDDEAGRENYARIARAAAAVFSMGDMIEYTPGSRNDLFFWPVDLQRDGGERFAPAYPDPDSRRPLRIVHAPNHRQFKGTRFLLAAVEKLRSDGFPIELQLIEKMPNRQALEAYRSADLVFDQCLVGFHGYVAIEAMALGKPVLTYIRRPQQYLLAPEECPLVSASADRLEAVLRDLLEDRRRLYELGVAGRRYVERYFTLEAFARRLETAYRELQGPNSLRRAA